MSGDNTLIDTEEHSLSIAVIGMVGRFPKADTLDEWWQLIANGVECVDFLSQVNDGASRGSSAELIGTEIRAALAVTGVDLFDAEFFGISPREAEVTDPQQRIFLEAAWSVFEHAGYRSIDFPGAIGLFAGCSASHYLFENILSSGNVRAMQSVGRAQIMFTNDKDYLATRVAYHLNLRGPVVTVQTACSTSLVAVHMACQSLLNGECDMALAGGVGINLVDRKGYQYVEGGILSRDGHCRPFDAQATGTLPGSGLGLVLLKRYDEALKDGDTIHAIIKGSAINNDGSEKVGFTAPSVNGQAAVIHEAQVVAEIGADDVSYVEAHGTGTALGDPIEFQALSQAFRQTTQRQGFCAIGSVKGNMGHADAAAGIAGLLKTVLALQHKKIPPSLNFQEANPHIDFVNSPFYVQTQLDDWSVAENKKRYAGVSSFGIGGTNAHVILSDPPERRPSDASRSKQLLVFSAKTPAALERLCNSFYNLFTEQPETSLRDAAYTLQLGRVHHAYRRVLVCGNHAEAIDALQKKSPITDSRGGRGVATAAIETVFMFSGQGTQALHMGQGLYQEEQVFREQIDICAVQLQSVLGFDFREILYPTVDLEEASNRLDQTQYTQPVLFALEYALARQLQFWGVRPTAMIGHSLGEYVAACLAGVFSLSDALNLVALRGGLISRLPAGKMLAVYQSVSEVNLRLNSQPSDQLWLAAVNGPGLCTIAGSPEAVDALCQQLTIEKIDFQILKTSHAFHSGLLDPVLGELGELLRTMPLHAPTIPYVSNLTGTWITAKQATDPQYWVDHLRHPVLFAAGVETLFANTSRLYLEIGPGHTLVNLLKRNAGDRRVHACSLLNGQGSQAMTSMLQAVGYLWAHGGTIDWPSLYLDETRYRIPLPTYPFERTRHWLSADTQPGVLSAHTTASSENGMPVIANASAQPEGDSYKTDSASAGKLFHSRPMLTIDYVSSSTPTERRLVELWEEALGIQPVGVNDNFFELGGHSLLATQLLARLRGVFKVELQLANLFDQATIANLAVQIEYAQLLMKRAAEKGSGTDSSTGYHIEEI
jgi:phthiocerol/phenolphthiocerol synthesis type-I polyketide synthase E